MNYTPPEVISLARRIAALEKDKVAAKTPALALSSIEDGAIDEYDGNDTLVASYGTQFDGTHVAVSLSGPPPPQPTAPQMTAGPLSLTARWNGLFTGGSLSPMDLKHIELELATDITFSDSRIKATITGELGDERVISPLDPTVTYYLRFVARSLSGKPSIPSDVVTASPNEISDTVANGKITVQDYAPTLADGTGKPVNATWSQIDPVTGAQVAFWRWTGTEWVDMPLGETIIPAINIGTGVYGTLRGVNLGANTFVGALITGAIIQTDAEAATGIKIDTDNLIGYNTLGNPIFDLHQNGVWIAGPVVSGGTITGSAFETTSLANSGVKINKAGNNSIEVFNPAGERTVYADGDTGDVSLVGEFATGAADAAGTTIYSIVDATATEVNSIIEMRSGSGNETFPAQIYVRSDGELPEDSLNLAIWPPQHTGMFRPSLQLFSEDANNSAAAYLGGDSADPSQAILLVGGNGRSMLRSPGGITLDAGDSTDGVLIEGGRLQFGSSLFGYDGVFFQSDFPFRFSYPLSTQGQTVSAGWFTAETAVETPEVQTPGPLKLAGGGFVGLEITADNLTSVTTYNRTTTASANMVIGSSSALSRSTSASRYKIDPQLMVLPDSLLDIEVKDWWDRSQMEARAALADAPQPLTEAQTVELDSLDMGRVPGVIAEDVEGHGGGPFVSYADGQIESVSYDRLAMARTAVLKRQLEELRYETDRRLLALEAP